MNRAGSMQLGLFGTLAAVVLLLLAAGCNVSSLVCPAIADEVARGELATPGADRVEADSDHFTVLSNHPLLAVDRGTVIDDLSGLNGCWGTIVDTDIFEIGRVRAAQFVRIDLAAGRIDVEGIERYDAQDRVVRSWQAGLIRIAGPNRLAIHWCASRSVDSGTAAATSPFIPPSDTMLPTPQAEVAMVVAVDGDALRWGDANSPAGLDSVLLQTDCSSGSADASRATVRIQLP